MTSLLGPFPFPCRHWHLGARREDCSEGVKLSQRGHSSTDMPGEPGPSCKVRDTLPVTVNMEDQKADHFVHLISSVFRPFKLKSSLGPLYEQEIAATTGLNFIYSTRLNGGKCENGGLRQV